ncbi:MAG: UDP-N-acetylmuramate dehydrogenase [Bacteroidetes bacterium]|uniref:UDP-N-acetylenolpyruvoylglucosamine reductase n=1 Tax=Candidatus Cryptobacteroides intestinigallinarum TaxID=2840767 RepID=A0A9D9HMF3_9BACT|nr:UDP-N-acetylmuramate dehydrogenase [Candidatus Cryptobacteroides intestinigallinarum]
MKITRNQDLTAWNTFRMRVSCACFVEYGSVEELSQLWNMRHGASDEPGESISLPGPFLHIGRGSNLLFTKDFPGTVFHSDIRFIKELLQSSRPVSQPSLSVASGSPVASAPEDKVMVEAGAGIIWDDFCRWCSDHGLWGPENLSGIPGETGAAAVQNIGAYGVEVSDFISQVRCFDCVTGRQVSLKVGECGYGYRDSMFKNGAKGRYVVTSVVFSLSRNAAPRLEYGHVRQAVEEACAGEELAPSLVRRVILGIRASKLPDPAETGSAGSFFKNPVVPRSDFERILSVTKVAHGADYPVPHFDAGSGFIKVPAAWLIDQCGLKGMRLGNAAVYSRQPLVIVNLTGAAAPEEILALEAKVVKAVHDKFGVMLRPEVEHI